MNLSRVCANWWWELVRLRRSWSLCRGSAVRSPRSSPNSTSWTRRSRSPRLMEGTGRRCLHLGVMPSLTSLTHAHNNISTPISHLALSSATPPATISKWTMAPWGSGAARMGVTVAASGWKLWRRVCSPGGHPAHSTRRTAPLSQRLPASLTLHGTGGQCPIPATLETRGRT